MDKTWLEEMTHRSHHWWMAAVQSCIKDASAKNEANPDHDNTDVARWMTALVAMVVESLPADESNYDGNMRAAAILSQILALWYCRLHRAKMCDPNRPTSIRQKVYARWLAWQVALFRILVDEREDPAFFPGQGWDLPFNPKAKGGTFV